MANATVGTASIALKVRTKELTSGINTAKSQMSNFANFLRKNVSSMGKLGNSFDLNKNKVSAFATDLQGLGSVGAKIGPMIGTAVPYIGAAITAIALLGAGLSKMWATIKNATTRMINFGKECATSATKAEKLQTILNSRVGNDIGKQLMDQVKGFATNYGLQVDPLISATHTLLDFGYKAKDIPSMLYMISTAATQAGGDINSATSVITTFLGRVAMTGVVTKKQLMTLQQNGIDIFGKLAEYLNTTTDKVVGKLNSLKPGEIINAITRSMLDSRGALENYANTYEARMQAVKNSIAGIKNTIGTMLLPYVKKGAIFIQATLNILGNYIKTHKDDIKNFLSNVWNGIRQFSKVVATIVQTIINALSSINIDNISNIDLNKATKAFINFYNIVVNLVGALRSAVYGLKAFVDYQTLNFKEIPEDIKKMGKAFEDVEQYKIDPNSIIETNSRFDIGALFDSSTNVGSKIQEEMNKIQNQMNNSNLSADINVGTNIQVDEDDVKKKTEKATNTLQEKLDVLRGLGANAWAMFDPMGSVKQTYNQSVENANKISISGQDRVISLLEAIAGNTGSLQNIENESAIGSIPLGGY